MKWVRNKVTLKRERKRYKDKRSRVLCKDEGEKKDRGWRDGSSCVKSGGFFLWKLMFKWSTGSHLSLDEWIRLRCTMFLSEINETTKWMNARMGRLSFFPFSLSLSLLVTCRWTTKHSGEPVQCTWVAPAKKNDCKDAGWRESFNDSHSCGQVNENQIQMSCVSMGRYKSESSLMYTFNVLHQKCVWVKMLHLNVLNCFIQGLEEAINWQTIQPHGAHD